MSKPSKLKLWWLNKQGWTFNGGSCKNCHCPVREHKRFRADNREGLIIKCTRPTCDCSGDVLTIADEQ